MKSRFEEFEQMMWIPTSECKPTEGVDVLVVRMMPNGTEGFDVAWMTDEEWFTHGDVVVGGVRAWRPIPEGPGPRVPKHHDIPITLIGFKLQLWADRIFARYGFPVYLVGSCLAGGDNVIDIDVRVILPDPDFNSRWPERSGWALEMGKQGRHAALFSRMNVDFQVQSSTEARAFWDMPRVRIDSCTYPEGKEPPKPGLAMGT